MGRYDASGDPPLMIPAVTLEEPLQFDADFARRLIRRDVSFREAFTVRDRTGVCFRASVKELTTDGGIAVPYERLDRSPESTVEITLACAVLARQRMIFIMQKATELGVARIVPLLTDHSVPAGGLEHEKAHAWPGQIIRAAKQCRRSSLPEVLLPARLKAFLASPLVDAADLCVYLDDRAEPASPPTVLPHRIVLVAGPEGGFSDTEREAIRSRALPLVLGGRVLRAETAVIVGLTAIHLRWGDFRTDQPLI